MTLEDTEIKTDVERDRQKKRGPKKETEIGDIKKNK